MSQAANVRSVDAIKDLKIALITFSEDARNALSSSDMEVRRIRDWLTRDQLPSWQAQVKRREEDVATAKSELFRRKVMAMNSEAISDTDQKEALRLAMRRLQQAEEMVAKIKRTIPYLEHAIAEYQSTSQPLGDLLAGGFVNTINLVERMVISLEQYLEASAPSAPRLSEGNAGGSSSGGASAKSTSSSPPQDQAATSDSDGAGQPSESPAETPAPAVAAEVKEEVAS